jgi:deazaflavin-dependent oxidoreductase (nitroreductase family)
MRSSDSTTAHASCSQFEARAYRGLNLVVSPLVRLGVGSSRFLPVGLTLLETRGRKTNRRHATPLIAVPLGETLVIATYRGRRSQWVRNAAANPQVDYWLDGKPRQARAVVLQPGAKDSVTSELSAPARLLASHLTPFLMTGWAIAYLTPQADSGS